MNSMVPCRRPFYAGNLLPELEFRQVRYCSLSLRRIQIINSFIILTFSKENIISQRTQM